jgi:GTP pyrophosphokinase
VASPRARSKIKAWFSKERRDEAMEEGKEHIARAMRKQNLPLQRLLNHETLLAVATSLGYPDISALYAAVGENHISAQNVVTKLVENLGGGDGTEETLSEGITPGVSSTLSRPRPAVQGSGVTVSGMDAGDIWVKLARCCTPVPGDDIVGFITRGQGVSVHRSDCQNALRLQELHPERFIEVSWDQDHPGGQFLVQIETRALDRAGLLSDLTKVLSDYRVNIITGSMSTSADQIASARFSFELADMSHLNAVLAALRRVDGVFEAVRLTGSERRP